MKIGIIGSRGIPNRYGGFEECAEKLSERWVKAGHEVFVYCSHTHPYSKEEFKGVKLIHKYDAEEKIGTAGQFLYDLNCILDAVWRKFDVILFLGYTSSSIWHWLNPAKPLIISNMDGLEWQRSKYSSKVQAFLKRAEKWAVGASDILIADAIQIRTYLDEKYDRNAIYIPYGAEVNKSFDNQVLEKYAVEAFNYNLLIARLEPENNLETILKGVLKSKSANLTLVMGNHFTKYGEYLKATYRDSRIRFVGPNFNKNEVNSLRHYAHIYFHGHTVGGTNPSLLEAMACGSLICAHNNPFNEEVLGLDGNYFIDENDVANAIDFMERNELQIARIKNNLNKIKEKYNWDSVAEQYLIVMEQGMI